MGFVRKSLLSLLVVAISCVQEPSEYLKWKLRSYYVLTQDGFMEIGGWKELESIESQALAKRPFNFWMGDSILHGTSKGQGLISVGASGPEWRDVAWSGGIFGLETAWMRGKIYLFMKQPVGRLYSWNGSGNPEPNIIPTLLTYEEAVLEGAWPLGEEWLLQWSAPRAMWTLFHERAGLEREVSGQELASLRERLRPQPASDVPAPFTTFVPKGDWTLTLRDDTLPNGLATYARNAGPTAFGLRRGDEVWILTAKGEILGTSTTSLNLPNDVIPTGLGAFSEGLLVLWRKETVRASGYEGVILLPWSVLEKSATL